MPTPVLELREFFHLALLRHLAGWLVGRPYAVKGGVCLRLFHRSPRCSQDMDLDIGSTVRVETLQRAVDALLESRAFLASLGPHGITRLEATKPKQTQTTQRWKVALSVGGDLSLPAKIEFSRRHQRLAYSTGVPDRELLARYQTPPFAAQYYGAEEMAAQKILALASAARYAVRDLFDLHHLCRAEGIAWPRLANRVSPLDIERASDKVGRFTYRDFTEQVLPYLPGTLMALFKDPAAFEQLRSEVEEKLLALLP